MASNTPKKTQGSPKKNSGKPEPFWQPARCGEWSCPHGVGHSNGIHGCDGCCSRPDYPGLTKEKNREQRRQQETK